MNLYEFHYTTHHDDADSGHNTKHRKSFKSVIAPNLAHAMAALPRDARNLQLKRVRAH